MSMLKHCIHCPKLAKGRGLCRDRYRELKRLVDAGTTTWASLESEGKALPAQSLHEKRNRFYRAMKQSRLASTAVNQQGG